MSSRAKTAVHWLAWIGGIALAVLVVSGVCVTFRYRPDATGTTLAMVRLHKWSSFVVGFAAVGIMVVLLPRRLARLWFAVASFVVAWVFVIATGRRLVWDQVVVFAVTVGREVQGMFFLHHLAKAVRVDGHEHEWEHFRNLFWLHSVVFPLVMGLAFALAMVWWRRLRGQSEMKSSAETPAAIRR